ncbi:response regulator [Paenibacillus sp.]|uniref:response regulator transcription factor n=1 Tax=Paenibacillus sp. TaxID=58172 RepID=UPI002D2B0930|nr:response regulator [Paenibacillus sp.]HZG85424.1 response regulator [Paenibacillus sp.]
MSYHLLLVDDEIHAIEGVKADLDLDELCISRLFTAYNNKQAREIFELEAVDILLCDIEMPNGSGLELLSWVREHHPNTATIFLTSHADFKYAKEALKLGSLDYLLKPVLAEDLAKAIRRAQSVIEQNSENTRNSQSHQLWMNHHSLIIERFWLDLINHTIPSNQSAIYEQIERKNLPITENDLFLPVLISVQRWNKDLKRRDERILEYALKNTAEEVLFSANMKGMCFYLTRGKLLGVFSALSYEHDGGVEGLYEAGRKYVEFCSQHFYCNLSCYIGRPVTAVAMADMVAGLREKDRNNVARVNQVFPFSEAGKTEQPIALPELTVWSSLLKNGKKEDVIGEVEKYLEQLVTSHELDAKTLRQFDQDFMQALYSFLNSEGIQAHRLFGDDESLRLSEYAGRSVMDMKHWIHHALNKAVKQSEAAKDTGNVIEFVKHYIASNIDEDLSRELIAEQVFLNPDYLSRIFKKETNYSISEYILLERIRLAKELLSQTNIPVSAVAVSVGYGNFPHFTRIFKKYAGVGPSEYRNQFGDLR